MKQNIMVYTPSGVKPHGYTEGDTWIRKVKEKDRMRIFDAWSIHPEAFIELKKRNIKWLIWRAEDRDYKISMDDFIKLGKEKKLVFEKEFSGGKTIYIQRKAFESKINQPTLV